MTAAPSPAIQESLALARSGDVVGAAARLERAIAEGEGQAAAVLAGWRLAGQPIRRDLGLARELFGKAVSLGFTEVEPAYIALLANGAGGIGRRWAEALTRLRERAGGDTRASREIALIDAMDIDEEGEPLSLAAPRALSERITLDAISEFMTRDECSFLVEISQPMLRPATVGDPRTGRMVLDPVRKARIAAFPFVLESPLVHAINRRIAAATGTRYEQGEPLQIITYAPGEEFKLHSDAVTHDPNQRLATVLVTLDDGFSGGATSFPRLDIEFRGKVGEALHFVNVDEAGRPEPLAWHAGLPVASGRKVILSKWIRTQPLDLSGPPGMPL